MADTLVIGGTTYTGVEGFKATDSLGNVVTYSSGNTRFLYTATQNLFFVDSNKAKPTGVSGKVTMDLPNCVNIQSMFGQYVATNDYATDITEAELTLYYPVIATNFLRRNTTITKITFTNGIELTGSTGDFCAFSTAIETIIGEISFDSAVTANTIVNAFRSTATLKDITFAENNIPASITFASNVLTDTSLVSISNGLSESATEQTLTVGATVKARMDALMGTVAMDSGNSYHVFTANSGGSVSLSSFVTNTKGWALE